MEELIIVLYERTYLEEGDVKFVQGGQALLLLALLILLLPTYLPTAPGLLEVFEPIRLETSLNRRNSNTNYYYYYYYYRPYHHHNSSMAEGPSRVRLQFPCHQDHS